ncbi:MAG: 4-hydroxy-tetrahydrodipicolinate synthase [Ruminococcus sp.]|nr:4-hydroxy-tetrahydrodipicolinate synthase [Candidatus Apopatosoma intestinale]
MFSGSYVALVTPFDADGNVNYLKLEELLAFQEKSGTDGVVLLGTTGESPTVSDAEAEKMICVTREHKGKMKLIVGCSSNHTRVAAEKAKRAERLGADGLLVLTPYYNKTNDAGLTAHFRTVADAVHIPIILYHVPGRTGCRIPIGVLQKLKEHRNIVGMKEASGDMGYFMKASLLADGDFCLFSGNDDLTVPMMSMGACGVISVLANLFPREVKAMTDLAAGGDFAEASKRQKLFLPLIEALFCETNPIPVKAAMNLLGNDVGGYRLPLAPMEEANKLRLAAELEKVKKLI